MGLGAMGRRHLRVLRSLSDRFDVTGGYDVRSDVPTPEGLSRFGSAHEAIERADVVIVATPIEAHELSVATALAAGRHVLVEKPLCASSREAHGLVGAARAGARLFVGHSERFNPVVRALARLLRGDELLSMDLRRVGPSVNASVGVLLNLGVHDLDLAAYLGGGDAEVRAAVGAGGDFAHVLLSTSVGAVAHVYVDRTFPTKQRSLVAATRRWIYEGDLLNHRLVRTVRATAARTDVPLPLEEPLTAQALALADALDGMTAREIAPGAEGARAVVLAEQAASHMTLAAGAQALGLHGR